MGLELLLGPLLGKVVAGLAAVAALLALYLGVKRTGAMQERERQRAADARAREAVQQRIDQARAQDRAVDAATQRDIDALRTEAQPPAPSTPPKAGDRFRF